MTLTVCCANIYYQILIYMEIIPEQGKRLACWKRLISLFVCINRDSSQPSVQFAPVLEWSPTLRRQGSFLNVGPPTVPKTQVTEGLCRRRDARWSDEDVEAMYLHKLSS